MSPVLLESNLPFPVRRGKVRDVYDLGTRLLIVATDRISAFDCIMPNGIPGKGQILTAMTLFWLDFLGQHMMNMSLGSHLINRDPASLPKFAKFADQLRGRSMLVHKAEVIPIECVARGYLAGSAWKDYQTTGAICGHELPSGLRQCDRLPQTIFTPATKESTGHDVNINFTKVAKLAPGHDGSLQICTLSLYNKASEYARTKGLIIADTKFEFGLYPVGSTFESLILIDEILTPDSSRFWPADKYTPGRDQESFDKQFVRNYLESIKWNKTPPAPELPADVVAGTRERYLEAYHLLTGRELPIQS